MSHESRFNLLEGALPPRRAYIGDAGLDICLQEDIIVYPGQTVRSPAKITLDLAPYVAAHVMTRSSTSDKRVTIIPTVIDQSYNGKEISIFVSNFNTYPVSLKRGDYLAQIVLMPYFTFANETGTQMNRTRNEGERFGSSDRQSVNEQPIVSSDTSKETKEMLKTIDKIDAGFEYIDERLRSSDEDDIDSMFKEDRPSEQKVFDQFTHKLGLTLTEAQDEYISSLPREQAKEMDDLCVSQLFVDKLAEAVTTGTNVVTVTPDDVIYDFVQESFSAFENSPVFTKVEDTDFGVVFHINDTLGDD